MINDSHGFTTSVSYTHLDVYKRQLLHIALLALLVAPIGIPVGIGILMAIIGIFIAAVSVILAFFAVSVTGILLGGLFIIAVSYTHLNG